MSDSHSPAAGPLRIRANGPRQVGAVLGLLGATSVLLSLGGDSLAQLLRYERTAVLAGEYWRLLTGHLVHGSGLHLLLNLVGLVLIGALFPRSWSAVQWLIVLAASLLAIDLGFVFWEPQLAWYVGLSGILHGALAAGAVAWWRQEPKALAGALTAIFLGKLAWEQLRGALPLSGDLPVIVDAHLYGAVGGLLAALLLCKFAKRWPFRS